MKKVVVKGMSCQHCVQSVTKALSAIDGVKDVNVSLEQGTATFEETKPVDPETVRKAITRIGFEAGAVE